MHYPFHIDTISALNVTIPSIRPAVKVPPTQAAALLVPIFHPMRIREAVHLYSRFAGGTKSGPAFHGRSRTTGHRLTRDLGPPSRGRHRPAGGGTTTTADPKRRRLPEGSETSEASHQRRQENACPPGWLGNESSSRGQRVSEGGVAGMRLARVMRMGGGRANRGRATVAKTILSRTMLAPISASARPEHLSVSVWVPRSGRG
jgi:hypothetical protein